MGSCVSCGKTDQIKAAMTKNQKLNQQISKILFLGAGESGKSTIIKQAQLIHGNHFNENERKLYIRFLTVNILVGAKNVCLACETLGNPLQGTALKAAEKIVELVESVDAKNATGISLSGDLSMMNLQLNDEIVKDLMILYEAPSFQKTIEESHKFQLEDTWPTLMEKLKDYPQWGGKSWIPSTEDVLLSRTRTTGINEVRLTLKDLNQKVHLIDVGGQRAERSKWLKLFTGISGVVFVTSLSEYNQVLFEDSNVNRLTESLKLFGLYGKKDELLGAPIMLFMNKYDLFKEKYYKKKIPLIKPLENCNEPPKVSEEKDDQCVKAIEWFFKLFAKQVEGKRSEEDLYPHVTTALDAKNVENALKDCAEYVLKSHLLGAGLISSRPTLITM